MRLLALSFAFASIAAPAPDGAADLLIPVDDGRYVLAEHCPAFAPCQSQSARPPSRFAPFDADVSVVDMSASQHSRWDIGSQEGAMHGSLASGSPSEPPPGNTAGDAVFDMTFDAEAAAYFAWTGAGSRSGGGYGGAFLHDVTADAIVFETSLPGSLDDSGTLIAGHRYRIYLHATTLGAGSADWDFDFAVVPEPGLAASLASGAALVSLLAYGSRRANPKTGGST